METNLQLEGPTLYHGHFYGNSMGVLPIGFYGSSMGSPSWDFKIGF